MAQDGCQFSGIVTATSTGVLVPFINATSTGAQNAFRAHMVSVINITTSQGRFIDFTGGGAVIATSSLGYPIIASQTLPLLMAVSPNQFWSGFSTKTSDGSMLLKVLALS